MDFKGKNEREIYNKVISIHSSLDQQKQPHIPLWDVTGKLFLPRRRGMLESSKPGQQYGANIFDDTPALSLRTFTQGFLGFMTNQALPWVQFTSSEQALMKIDAIKDYYQKAQEQCYYGLRQSTFYSASKNLTEDFAWCGNASWIPIKPRDEDRIVFKGIHPKKAFWSTSASGSVTVYHVLKDMKAESIVEEFGDKAPQSIKNMAKNNPFARSSVIMAWYKNPNYVVGALDKMRQRWIIFYVLNGSATDGKNLLKVDASQIGPIVWRNNVEDGEEYGTGLAADALTVALMGNKLGEKMITAAHLAVEPVIMASKTLKRRIRLNPGARNFVDKDEDIKTIMDRLNWPIGDAERETIRNAIKEWMFVPLFQSYSGGVPEMTAYQARQIQGEKAVLMSGISGTFEQEVGDPSIAVILENEERMGRMPPVPPELEFLSDGNVDIEYIGVLPQLQRSLFKSQGILEGIQVASEWSNLFPESLNKIKGDEGLEAAMVAQGFPQDLIRSDEEMEVIHQAELRRAAIEQQAELVGQASQSAPGLSKPIEPNSPLSLLGVGEAA